VYRARPRLFRFGRPGGLPRQGQGAPAAPAPDPSGYPPPPPPYDTVPSNPSSVRAPYPGGPYPPSPSGLGPAPTSRVRRGWLPGRRGRRLAVLLAVVALVVYPVLVGITAVTNLTRVTAFPASGRPAATPGRTFLVVGSDSRQDLTREERARLGTGQAVGQRTDTIMLLHLPSGGGPTVLVSLPRDSYVPIPGHGRNKINAAYAFGGPQLLVRTVEQVTGLRVDDYVETGLAGYANLVDAIGGVRICVKRAMNDPKAHINLKPGCQQLDGKTALGYARSRYSDPQRGDLARVEHQREVLAAIGSKTLSPSVLAVPWRAFAAARAGGRALTVDDGTSAYAVARFVLAIRSVSGSDGISLTVPIAANISTPAGDALQWNRSKAVALFEALQKDDTESVRALTAEQKKPAA
jgi:LCP family protein required for cell wall assembly